MFRFSARLPVSEEDRVWADGGFARLAEMLGSDALLCAEMVLPDDRFFPDRYDGSRDGVRAMAARIAGYMGVAHYRFEVEVYAENEEAWRESVPLWSGETNDAAGLYFRKPEEGRYLIGVHANQLGDPIMLAATLAHELAHVVLLGGGLLEADSVDMEPLTDLCTVFLGMGYFTASAAFQFKQWTDNQTQGWSTQRFGYLAEPMWGYALAVFAEKRGEVKPEWAKLLPRNILEYFQQSVRWMKQNAATDRMK